MSNVPDHRLDEVMQRLRAFESENMRLRGTVDALMQRPQAQASQPEPEESPFQPEVERALQVRFEREMAKRFAPIEQQTKQAIGALADQNDHLKFALRYGQDTWEKFQDKIERVREERSRAGQWVSREDAYRLVYFDEHGKKPAVTPQTAPAAAQTPALDPYTGLMREQAAEDTQAQNAPPAVPFQPAAQVPPVQAPAQTPLPPLPPQSMAPMAPSTAQTQTQVPGKLDVAMGSPELTAWADKYGDIPL